MDEQHQSDSLKQMADDFSQVKISREQRQMFNVIASLMSDKLNVNELALKGFIWKSLREVQIEFKTTAEELAHKSPEERVKVMKKGFERLGDHLMRVLRNKEKQEYIRQVLNDGFAYYIQKYSQR